jgi:signal transduction histidine kinase/ActR/RegA family two-component response regulator
MNVLSLFSFVAGLVYAGLGLYAMQPRPRTAATWVFVGLCASMSFWALTFTFAYPAPTAEQYVFLTRASALGSATSPAIFLHFALVLTTPRRRLPAWAFLALYVPVTVTIAAEWTYPFREGVDFVMGWAGWTRTFAGIAPLFVLQRIIHGGLFIAGLLLIHRWGVRSPVPRERLQARVIVRTGAATVSISLFLDTVLPLCGWRPLPTTVPIVGTLWASGIAYAMLRHRFMVLDPALAGGILHDFNNLLTAVEGHIDLVRRTRTTPPEIVRSLDEADRAARRARRLAHRFMAYVTGQPPPRERVRVRELLAEAALLVADRPGYRCEMDLAPDLGWLEADEGQLLQAIGNLLVNAREAMPDGGVIAIRADTCVVDAGGQTDDVRPPPGRHVRIRVADLGMGIAPDLLPRVFEPFVSTKRRGSGLGLAMVRRAARSHGGAVAVRSTPGRGTEFTLWLPLPPDEETGGQAAPTPGSSPRRLLVMEDDPLVAAVTVDMLAALGHRPLVCRDGDDAVARYVEAAASDDPFDLVLVDFTIHFGPGGPATLARLHELDPEARVVLMSGSRENIEIARAAAMGFAGFLLKPFSLESLSRVLEGSGGPAPGRETPPDPPTAT